MDSSTVSFVVLVLFGAWYVHCLTRRHSEIDTTPLDLTWRWSNLPTTKDELIDFFDIALDNYESSHPTNNEISARLEFTDGTIYVYNGGGFVEVEDRPITEEENSDETQDQEK